MVVSDPTALFTFPLLVTLSENVFNLLNQLGILYLPFLAAIAKGWVSARAQGNDEGASQIMALKFLERDFISKFTILMLCVVPISVGYNTTQYKQFSTSSMPSLITGVETVAELKPNSTYADMFGYSSMPLAFGLVHEAIMGMSNVLIAKLPCSVTNDVNQSCATDGNLSYLSYYLGSVRAQPFRKLTKQINTFHSECYIRAYQRHLDAQNNGYAFTPPNPDAYPYTSNVRMAFYGDLMFYYYGEVTTNTGDDLPHLFVTGETNETHCSTEANELYDAIKDHINTTARLTDQYQAFVKGWVDLFSRYSGRNVDGSVNIAEVQANESEALHAVMNSLYGNTVNIEYKKSPHFSKTGDTSQETSAKAMLALNASSGDGDGDNLKKKSFGETIQFIALSAIHMIGLAVEGVSKMVELYIASVTLPALVHISLGTLVLVGPLAIVLSSYNPTITSRIFITYIGLAFSVFIYEAMQVLTNNVLVMALDYDIGALVFDNGVKGLGASAAQAQRMLLLSVALKVIPLSGVIIWNVLLQILGGRALKSLEAGVKANTNIFNSPAYSLGKMIANDTYNETKKNLKEDRIYRASMEALDEFENDLNSRIENGSDPHIERFIKDQEARLKREAASFSLSFSGGGAAGAHSFSGYGEDEFDSQFDAMWDEYNNDNDSADYPSYDDEDYYGHDEDYYNDY